MSNISFIPEELKWIGVRFLDPIGKVFFLDGDYYRAIYPDKVDYVKNLFQSGVIDELINRNLILPIEISNISVKDFGLVLKTNGTTWNIEGHTYTWRTLKKIASCWIEINEILLPHHLGLIDGHLKNVVISGKCRPFWIDIGSIQPLGNIDMGFKEFFSYQLYPLIIFESHKKFDRIARLLIQYGGISIDEFSKLNGFRIKGLSVKLMVKIINRNKRLSKKFISRNLYLRKFLLRFICFIVKSIDTTPINDLWTNYRNNDADYNIIDQIELNADIRPKKILELIKIAQPKTLMDVGANDGYFSILSASVCKKLLVSDLDAGAIEKFARWVENTPLDIEVCYCIDDFHHIKHQAELVLGLALVHHIAIKQKYKFDYIARRFSEMSSNYLITEFMPNGCGVNNISPNPLPDYYNLDVFVCELKNYFKTVKIIDYNRSIKLSSRILIYCSKESNKLTYFPE